MSNRSVRSAETLDFNAIVSLNSSEVQFTSPMDFERLNFLDSISAYHKTVVVDGRVAAFLLVMRDGCNYLNDNFQWFSARYDSFLYVDRIVVGRDFQGRKFGKLLYEDLFGFARKNSFPNIVCEYNLIPPNEVSRAFHNKFSFREVGTQWLCNGAKKVSLQLARS
jgi:predicted GNAT superfamily acetyltransferase